MAWLAKISTCKITNEPEEQALTCGFTVERDGSGGPAREAAVADTILDAQLMPACRCRAHQVGRHDLHRVATASPYRLHAVAFGSGT